jgi:putative membrane protein
MISGYMDHAVNERTFLAWVRTGITVIAFGFVIEKFFTMASASSLDARGQLQLERLSGPFGRYHGTCSHFRRIGADCGCVRAVCADGATAR